MFEIVKHPLNERQLLHELEQRRGLIPIGLNLEERQLIWRDLDHYHPYEGFFRNTIKSINALQPLVTKQTQIDYFTTDVAVLHSSAVVRDSIYPSGFIFHMGRCGSTLLAKALARSRSNLIFSEAAPHNMIWPYLGGQQLAAIEKSDANLNLYRNLILAMGRRRLPAHRYHFIKFTSFDVLFLDFILTAFPTVSVIFLYREPAEVLVSLLAREASWVRYKDAAWGRFIAGTDTFTTSDTLTFFSNALRNFMSTALESKAQGVYYLNYSQLTADNLPTILTVFDVDYSDAELTQMQSQFGRYSKADFSTVPFVADKSQKQRAQTPEMSELVSRQLEPLYMQLAQSRRNIGRGKGWLQSKLVQDVD